MGSLFPCLASEKMWENFKLGKISKNRNKNVKWNTVTYPLKLPCQWSFVTHSLFPIILLFALQVLHQTRTRTSHAHVKTQFYHSCEIVFHDYYITYAEKLGNFFSWLLHTHIAHHTHTWRHNSIIPVKLFFMTITLHMQKNSKIFFHDYCIRRKTWKF